LVVGDRAGRKKGSDCEPNLPFGEMMAEQPKRAST